jgi:hypothetical protein
MRPAGIAIIALAALAPPAGAQTGPAFSREVHGSLGGSVNPLGLQQGLEVSWTRSLSDSKSALWRDAHVSFGLTNRLTPAYERAGAWVELAPLSILDVRAGVEPTGYFGTFHSLLSFQGYDDAFGDDTRKTRSGARAGFAGRAYLAPTLKARAGRLILRAHAELEWWRSSARGPFFYEPGRDTLLRSSGDSMVAGDTALLWEIVEGGPRKLLLGPFHELAWVYAAGRNRRQDVGLVAVWGLGTRTFGLREPMVVAKVLRYVEDPYKRSQFGAQLAVAWSMGKP